MHPARVVAEPLAAKPERMTRTRASLMPWCADRVAPSAMKNTTICHTTRRGFSTNWPGPSVMMPENSRTASISVTGITANSRMRRATLTRLLGSVNSLPETARMCLNTGS